MLKLDITEASELFTLMSKNYNELTCEQKELFKKIYEAIREHLTNKLN